MNYNKLNVCFEVNKYELSIFLDNKENPNGNRYAYSKIALVYVKDIIKYLLCFGGGIYFEFKNGYYIISSNNVLIDNIPKKMYKYVDSFEEADCVLHDKKMDKLMFIKINIDLDKYDIKKTFRIYSRELDIQLNPILSEIITKDINFDEILLDINYINIKITRSLDIETKKIIEDNIKIKFPKGLDIFNEGKVLKKDLMIRYENNTLNLNKIKF